MHMHMHMHIHTDLVIPLRAAKALLAPSLGLGLRPALRASKIVPDDFVRGELVPQDPNDEPASVLLERIKAQRAAAPKARRGRRAATPS